MKEIPELESFQVKCRFHRLHNDETIKGVFIETFFYIVCFAKIVGHLFLTIYMKASNL